MRKLLTFAGAATSLLLLSAPVFAHHGFAGRYDEDHPVTVTGTVLELQFMNPHSFIIFENKDASGKSLRWQAELGSANPQNKNGSADLNLSHESKITMADSGKVIHNSIKAEQGQNGQGGGAAAPPAAY